MAHVCIIFTLSPEFRQRSHKIIANWDEQVGMKYFTFISFQNLLLLEKGQNISRFIPFFAFA